MTLRRAAQALVALLALVHLVTGAWAWQSGRVATAAHAWLTRRPPELRAALGGIDDHTASAPWRLVSSTLQHADLLHIGINAAALLSLARLLDRLIRTPRFVLLFVGGGVVATTVAWATGVAYPVGPSGGVLALLGAGVRGARAARAARRDDDPRFRGLVPALGAVIALDVGWALVDPQVDAAAHITGLVVGLLVGPGPAPLRRVQRRKEVVMIRPDPSG